MATRILTGHVVNPANDKVLLTAEGEPGPGGAYHWYKASYADPKAPHDDFGKPLVYQTLRFQNGAIDEVGVNGITHEVLLAVLVDRLECFQKGPYACRENAIALTHLQDAQHWLQHRTRARMARGVEGTMAV